jgi:hypothetical protein
VNVQENFFLIFFFVVFPVLGDTNDVSTWIPTAIQADVIIDATSPSNEPTKHAKIILDAVIEIGKKRLENNEPALTFIYTSGLWVYFL